MSLLLDIAPADLGLPNKFTAFRDVQATAIDFIQSADRPFIAGNAPTGTGKSLLAVTAAVTSDSKSVYLTGTKALQDQILTDFGPIGMKDIRGRGNYPCRVYTTRLGKPVSCDYGAEHNCPESFVTACPYVKQYETAKQADLIATNYSYWLHARSNAPNALEVPGDPDGKVEFLICDEAHNVFNELVSFLAVKLPKSEYQLHALESLTGSGFMSEATGERWKGWANLRIKEINGELRSLITTYGTLAQAKEEEGERVKSLERMKLTLSGIVRMSDNWVWETTDEGVTFDPIWPGQYSHLLWSGVPRVLLLSATLWPYTLSLLGISKDDYQYKEFSNGWKPNLAPVFYLPTVRLSYKSTDEDYARVVERMDEIISARSDRKGIIHTVSYNRMARLLQHSKHHRIMFYNESSRDSVRVAERFRAAKPPAVLISPSFGTGWDFAFDQCEYQILPKIPFPYSENRVMKERIRDERFRIYCAMLEMTQMIGRGRRAHNDRCETFILDNSFPLVMSKGRKFAAKGFNAHRISEIPKKPEKLPAKSLHGL